MGQLVEEQHQLTGSVHSDWGIMPGEIVFLIRDHEEITNNVYMLITITATCYLCIKIRPTILVIKYRIDKLM